MDPAATEQIRPPVIDGRGTDSATTEQICPYGGRWGMDPAATEQIRPPVIDGLLAQED
jgi:hypothetical protein